jgi:phosphate acetyltransferase
LTQNLYVTGAERGSGKSVVVLAMMDILSGHDGRIGFFRPVIRSQEAHDELAYLISERYQLDFPPEVMYGCTSEVARELIAADRYDDLLKAVLEKFGSIRISQRI